jgi:hypothetical protein
VMDVNTCLSYQSVPTLLLASVFIQDNSRKGVWPPTSTETGVAVKARMRGAGGASGGVMMVHRGGDRSDHSLGPSQFSARIWRLQKRNERGVHQHEAWM